jgi:hypothetical protein
VTVPVVHGEGATVVGPEVVSTGAAVGWGAEGAADGSTLGDIVGVREGAVVGRLDVGLALGPTVLAVGASDGAAFVGVSVVAVGL